MNEILTELKKLGDFAAWGWSSAPTDGEYGVISADGQNALRAGGALAEKVQEGTIDWFTRDPDSAMPASIEYLLNVLGASWYLNSVQYESDTGLLHYEWVWQYG